VFGPLNVERGTVEASWWAKIEEIDIDVADGRGGAATSLYNVIERRVPEPYRVDLERFHLSSPGEITMRLSADVAKIVHQAVHEFSRAGGSDAYNMLYLERHREEDEIDDDAIERRCRILCEIVHLNWIQVVESFPRPRTRADFVLAQARYTQSLASYLRGKIESF
jgi:hypothetical protein